MNKISLKDSVRLTTKDGIHFLLDDTGKKTRNKPWLGDLFSFLYDRIMEKSVFPKKFNASIAEHYKILEKLFEKASDKTILEFATGSGDAVRFLKNNNIYAGVDISTGLLRIAKKKFDLHRFTRYELYNADACETPFRANTFDIAICNLSMNFFPSADRFISEAGRILQPNGIFYGCVPVPERKNSKVTIHGKLYTRDELKGLFGNKNFSFEPFPFENGALLYFKATLKTKQDRK